MYFLFVIVLVAVLTSAAEMATLEEFQKELNNFKKKIERMEKFEDDVKNKMSELEENQDRMEREMFDLVFELQNKLENKMDDYAKKFEDKVELLEKKCSNNVEDMKDGKNDEVDDIEDQEDMVDKIAEKVESALISKMGNDTEDRLHYLEELSKLNLRRSCFEMGQYGVQSSNFYFVDPDGPLIGAEPIRVWCEFTDDGRALTEITHNTEQPIEVDHCDDPGCYVRPIVYSAPEDQIRSLIELSESCEQSIQYNCLLAPLMKGDVSFGFWLDKDRKRQVYWDGAHSGQHVCSCYFDETGCVGQGLTNTTCNCDASVPEMKSDVGTIRDMSALPITELQFGGLNYGIQQASHQLGRLRCWGSAHFNAGESCTAIKRAGEFRSGFYNVKKTAETNSQLVFCNASSGYDENDQNEEFIESSEDHFIQVEGDISAIETNVTDVEGHVSTLEKRSSYCGYRYEWNTDNSDVTYDKLTLNDSHDVPSSFNIATGKFRAGVNGIYQVDVSMRMWSTDGVSSEVYVRKNGVDIEESNLLSYIATSANSGEIAGRSFMLDLNYGDTVSLYAHSIYNLDYITFCVHLTK